MNKKICVVRVNKTVTFIKAAYIDGLLHVAEVTQHKADNSTLNSKLLNTLKENFQKGYTIAVDEQFKHFSKGFGLNSLRQEDVHGKPKFVTALDAYNHLKDKNYIRFVKGVSSIKIPDSLIDKEVNSKGEVVYLVDWDGFTDKAGCLLLASYVALTAQNSDMAHLRSVLALSKANRLTGRRLARGIST